MSFITNLSLKIRITAMVAALMIAAIGITSWVGHTRYQASYLRSVDETGNVALRGLTTYLSERFENVEFELDEDGHLSSLVWPSLTPFLAEDAADAIQNILEIEATIFSYDRVSNEFTRVSTTIVDENGTRQVGTELIRGETYDTLINGEAYHGEGEVLGQQYYLHYVPVLGLDGNLVGSIASALPLETVLATLRKSVIEKLIISSIVLTVFLLAAFALTYVLLRPFGRITESVVDLSNGKIEEEIDYTNRGDEIGAISNALLLLQNSMQAAEQLKAADVERSQSIVAKQQEQEVVVRALTEGLARLGKLDLTQQIENTPSDPFPADYEELRTSFNMLVDSLSESVAGIRDIATEVSQDSREMAEAAADLSSRTENQAATLEESAAALEQMSASVQSTAGNAGDAETTTTENRTNAKRAGEIVDTAIEAMAAIEESSQKITQIISVIDDIAFQTNLLALNAGVEAARAGDAGRGFAVVASEVRALAQHSSASAQEIKTLIASSSSHVENGSKLVHNAGESINDIIERVDRVTGLVSDIAVSAKEQSIGVSEISGAVRELDSATQGNAAMAEETAAASEGLTNASDRLAQHLARFQLANTPKEQNWGTTDSTEPTVDDAEMAQAKEAFAPKAVANVSGQGNANANAFSGF